MLFQDEEAQELETRYHFRTKARSVGHSLYKGEDDDQIVYEMMSNGSTVEQVCRELGISLKTYFRWRKAHPTFGAADEAGKAASMAKWQEIGEHNLDSKSFNSSVWDKCLAMRKTYMDFDYDRKTSQDADAIALKAMIDIITRRQQED